MITMHNSIGNPPQDEVDIPEASSNVGPTVCILQISILQRVCKRVHRPISPIVFRGLRQRVGRRMVCRPAVVNRVCMDMGRGTQ